MKSLYAAMGKAQSEVGNAKLNQVNPHFKSKFADLQSIRDAVIPTFTKHGISIMQAPIIKANGQNVLETVAAHGSGGTYSFHTPICNDGTNAIKWMAAVTSARRTALSSLACISAEEDRHLEEDTQEATKTISESLVVVLENRIEEVGANQEKFFKAYGIKDIADLPMAKFPDAMNKLDQTERMKKEKAEEKTDADT
jgi:hypothetical protein